MANSAIAVLAIVCTLLACGDDEPTPPDAELPLCADLGCNATLCTACVTVCMGQECMVP